MPRTLCEHGKRKAQCSECGGRAFCIHGRRKAQCRECGGRAFCEHNRRKAGCRACGSSAFCEHGRQKSQCRDCGGRAFCEHGQRKVYCRECGGGAFCEHGKRREYCRECGGNGICEHGKRSDYCGECGGSQVCRNQPAQCGTIGNPRYEMYCTHCFANLFPDDPRTAGIRTKSKETTWVNALLQTEAAAGHAWTWDKPLYVTYGGGCCDSKRRIDLWTLVGNTVVAIEIDEYQHKSYPSGHEAVRYNDLVADFTGRYVFLRINPDPFRDASGVRVDPPLDERVRVAEEKLAEVLDGLDDDKENDGLVAIHHLFFDGSVTSPQTDAPGRP